MTSTLLLAGCGLLAAGSPIHQGKYFYSSCLGPHCLKQVVQLHGRRFTSTEWRTGFFDANDQTLTGVMRPAGDTLHLVPQAISYYVLGKHVKGKGWKYHKRHCGCRAMLADTARLANPRLSNQRRLNQQLCRQGYVLLITADSLTEVVRDESGVRLARGFRKVVETAD